MIYNFVALVAILLCGPVCAMESKSEEKSEKKEIAIELERQTQNRHATRNAGDYSIWYGPEYKYAKCFVHKKPEEVDSVFQKLANKTDAPFALKDKLTKLREIISECAQHEEYCEDDLTKGNIYFTCLEKDIVKVRTILEDKELTECKLIYKLQEKKYDDQVQDILNKRKKYEKQENARKGAFITLTLAAVIVVVFIIAIAGIQSSSN
jgi:hypothetical protein